jgi:hypothetical protein
LWGAAGSWFALMRSRSMLAVSVDWQTGIPEACRSMWTQLPATLAHALAIAVGIGLLAGAVMTIFWPKLSRVTTWSLGGITLIVVMLAAAQQTTHSNLIASLKLSDALQATALAGLVVLGALIQWGISPRSQPSVPRKRPLPMEE